MSLPQVTSWFDAVMLSITAALVTFLSFIPAIAVGSSPDSSASS